MMTAAEVVFFQICYLVPGMVIYLFLLVYITYKRDHRDLQTPFFSLFRVRAVADILQTLISLFFFRLPISGIVPPDVFLQNPILARIGFSTSQFLMLFLLCVHLMLSLNRFTAVFFPIKQEKLWERRKMCIFYTLCLIFALIPTLTRIRQPAWYILFKNATAMPKSERGDQKLNSWVSSVIYFLFCIACVLLNSLTLYQLHKRRQDSACWRLQANLMIYSTIFTATLISMTAFQLGLAFDAFANNQDVRTFLILALTASADAFSLLNPILLFTCSSPFRKILRESVKSENSSGLIKHRSQSIKPDIIGATHSESHHHQRRCSERRRANTNC